MMRSAAEVSKTLDLTEEEVAVIREIQQRAKTREAAAQYAGILQLYDELQTTKRYAAQNPSKEGFTGLLNEQVGKLRRQIQQVQPSLVAAPNAPEVNAAARQSPSNPLVSFLQRAAATVRDAAVSLWSGLKSLYQQVVAPQVKSFSTTQQESDRSSLLHSSDAQVMASLNTADPGQQARQTQKVRVERAERAVAAAYKGLASLPNSSEWKERIVREEQILKQERIKYLEMGGVLVEKIKLPDPVQPVTQGSATSEVTRPVTEAQRTDAVLFLAKVAILEKLEKDDPKRQKFILEEKRQHKMVTGKEFDPEAEYTFDKFIEKHGEYCRARTNTGSGTDSVLNIGLNAMPKACQLIGKDPRMTTDFTRDDGVQYANRVIDKIQSKENTSSVENVVSPAPVPSFGRG